MYNIVRECQIDVGTSGNKKREGTLKVKYREGKNFQKLNLYKENVGLLYCEELLFKHSVRCFQRIFVLF